MNPLATIAFQYGLPLGALYLSYRYLWKGSLPNISYKGWGYLATRYKVKEMPAGGLILTMRIGSQTYNFNNMSILLAAEGMYLQRKQFGSRSTVCIPYEQIRLAEGPSTKKVLFFTIPVYGLFYVGAVDLWIDSPYAEHLITQLHTIN
ncbi:MAG: hypothetical protein EOO55_03180 [Hymenobacter sp.]|nr:MAG: hypothetical protein EOO55_03180 [Hymenobacter sp.]